MEEHNDHDQPEHSPIIFSLQKLGFLKIGDVVLQVIKAHNGHVTFETVENPRGIVIERPGRIRARRPGSPPPKREQQAAMGWQHTPLVAAAPRQAPSG